MRQKRKISLQTVEEGAPYAIFKARTDVNVVLQSLGFQSLVFGSTSPIGIWRVIMRHVNILSLRWKIKPTDTVFLQFPWIHHNKKEFYDNLFESGAKVDCIIHDLDSLRYKEQEKEHGDELVQLNRCHSIIAHTPSMKEYLISHGVDGEKIKILYVFPYLTEDALHDIDVQAPPTVIFAGNLAKSPFVNELHTIADDFLRFNIYGNGADDLVLSDYISYEGVFNPSHPGLVEGNWGLVWDGADINTCSGKFGSYLRYNSSHKISLYLSLGIPVILWSESSLKDYVLEHNLGICVDSLTNLKDTLLGMSIDRKLSIVDSVRRFSSQIGNGDILRRIIYK